MAVEVEQTWVDSMPVNSWSLRVAVLDPMVTRIWASRRLPEPRSLMLKQRSDGITSRRNRWLLTASNLPRGYARRTHAANDRRRCIARLIRRHGRTWSREHTSPANGTARIPCSCSPTGNTSSPDRASSSRTSSNGRTCKDRSSDERTGQEEEKKS